MAEDTQIRLANGQLLPDEASYLVCMVDYLQTPMSAAIFPTCQDDDCRAQLLGSTSVLIVVSRWGIGRVLCGKHLPDR